LTEDAIDDAADIEEEEETEPFLAFFASGSGSKRFLVWSISPWREVIRALPPLGKDGGPG